MAANSKTFQFKLVLLGDSAVGKSSLVLRFVRMRSQLVVFLPIFIADCF